MESDEENLRQLQDDFLENNSKEAWDKMWLISFKVCQRILVKMIKRSEVEYLPEDEVYNKTLNAVEYVFKRYKKIPGYKIKCFITTLEFGCKHAFYYTNKETLLFNDSLRFEAFDNVESLNKILENSIPANVYGISRKTPHKKTKWPKYVVHKKNTSDIN